MKNLLSTRVFLLRIYCTFAFHVFYGFLSPGDFSGLHRTSLCATLRYPRYSDFLCPFRDHELPFRMRARVLGCFDAIPLIYSGKRTFVLRHFQRRKIFQPLSCNNQVDYAISFLSTILKITSIIFFVHSN